jgi:hypothetical protein
VRFWNGTWMCAPTTQSVPPVKGKKKKVYFHAQKFTELRYSPTKISSAQIHGKHWVGPTWQNSGEKIGQHGTSPWVHPLLPIHPMARCVTGVNQSASRSWDPALRSCTRHRASLSSWQVPLCVWKGYYFIFFLLGIGFILPIFISLVIYILMLFE